MHKLRAKLDYHSIWCVAWTDKGLCDYLFSLIPKYYYPQRPKYQAHITVVSKYDADNRDMSLWGKYQDEVVEVEYDPVLRRYGEYFGITCYSQRLKEIRRELGLTELMGGNIDFHLTIGNTK